MGSIPELGVLYTPTSLCKHIHKDFRISEPSPQQINFDYVCDLFMRVFGEGSIPLLPSQEVKRRKFAAFYIVERLSDLSFCDLSHISYRNLARDDAKTCYDVLHLLYEIFCIAERGGILDRRPESIQSCTASDAEIVRGHLPGSRVDLDNVDCEDSLKLPFLASPDETKEIVTSVLIPRNSSPSQSESFIYAAKNIVGNIGTITNDELFEPASQNTEEAYFADTEQTGLKKPSQDDADEPETCSYQRFETVLADLTKALQQLQTSIQGIVAAQRSESEDVTALVQQMKARFGFSCEVSSPERNVSTEELTESALVDLLDKKVQYYTEKTLAKAARFLS